MMANEFSLKLAKSIRLEILANTAKGIDKDGNPFTPYSDRPFAMPAGAVANKQTARRLQKKQTKNDPIITWFRHRNSGKHWIIWHKGYSHYKKTFYHSSTPDLAATEGMQKGFTILDNKDNWNTETIFKNQKIILPIPEMYIVLGWNKIEEQKKAFWNMQKRSDGKKGRDMLGLPEKQLNSLVRGFVRTNFI